MFHLTLVVGAFAFFLPLVTSLVAREHGLSGWKWFTLGCVLQFGAALALWWIVRKPAPVLDGRARFRILAGDGEVRVGRPVPHLRLVRAGE